MWDCKTTQLGDELLDRLASSGVRTLILERGVDREISAKGILSFCFGEREGELSRLLVINPSCSFPSGIEPNFVDLLVEVGIVFFQNSTAKNTFQTNDRYPSARGLRFGLLWTRSLLTLRATKGIWSEAQMDP